MTQPQGPSSAQALSSLPLGSSTTRPSLALGASTRRPPRDATSSVGLQLPAVVDGASARLTQRELPSA